MSEDALIEMSEQVSGTYRNEFFIFLDGALFLREELDEIFKIFLLATPHTEPLCLLWDASNRYL